MSQISQFEQSQQTKDNLLVEDGINTVLDSVLEDIDGLLLDHIPPNPLLHNNAQISTESGPVIPESIYEDHLQRKQQEIEETISHQFHLAQQQQQEEDCKKEDDNYDAMDPLTENDNVLLNGFSTKILLFQYVNNSLKLQLKDYVFISKDCTKRLSEYIVKERWGKDHTLLYKYIDYIFRCQAFKKQIILINNKYLIFHCGLQRRTDKQFLYVLLVPNKKYATPKWRVPFGNIKNSFLSKAELLSKLPQSYLIEDYFPKRTKFCTSLSELLYDHSFSIQVNWEERLTTNKDRIYRVLGNIAFFDSNIKFMKLTELIEAFSASLQNTQQIAELNPRLAVAQGFIDTKHSKYRMELLLPLIIEFPKYSANFYMLALAISKSTECESTYVVKSILTMDMAYSNARLVGYVDSIWLSHGKNNEIRSDMNDFFFCN